VVHSGGESLFRALQQLHSSAEFMRKRAVNKAAALEEYRAEEESKGLRLVRQVGTRAGCTGHLAGSAAAAAAACVGSHAGAHCMLL
jgi:hypothetical protein